MYELSYPATTTSIGDGTPFSNYVIDPWQACRGTFMTSGALTAPAAIATTGFTGAFIHGEGGCQIASAIPSGGATTTPTYTATLERFTNSSPTYAPGTGTVIASGIAADEGGAIFNYLDTTSVSGVTYYYRWWFTDGTSTVYFPSSTLAPLIARRRANGAPIFIAYAGDSVRERPSLYIAASTLSRFLDRPVNWFCYAKSGAYARNWTNGTNGVYTIYITGTPTSGQFVLNTALAGATAITGQYVPYNCTATQLQTILQDNTGAYSYPSANGQPNSTNNAIGGAGNVTVTGGPLPTSPLVVTFNGPTSQKKAFYVAPNASNSTLNNGATASVAVNYNGAAADTTYFVPMCTSIAAFSVADSDMQVVVDQAVGENDSTGGGVAANATLAGDYANYLLSGATYYASQGWKAIIHTPALARTPNTVYNAINVNTQGAAYEAALQAIDNGSTIRFGGSATLINVIIDPLGTADGLHASSASNETNWQRWCWARNTSNLILYGTLTPGAGGGGGGTRRFGIGFGG
ncbi:hypothetical protein [Frigoriglobus tundricola]|nr:hypothetical protein [Frigoriglobus tundricola]